MILNRGAWRAAIAPPDEIPLGRFLVFFKKFYENSPWYNIHKYEKVLYCYMLIEKEERKMNEDKIENMLSQLIRMVGNIQSEQQEMKQVQQDMQGRLQGMESKLQEMDSKLTDIEGNLQGIEVKGEERHQEVLGRFKALEIDQDFIWEKTVRNEREIGTIKRQLN